MYDVRPGIITYSGEHCQDWHMQNCRELQDFSEQKLLLTVLLAPTEFSKSLPGIQ